jgi:NAD(P)-dependent dehydrogenase (short-subunit alcohol dehydrogenase family)
VNLRGVWLTDLYAARAMAEQESGGSIVNTASVYGLVGSDAMGYNPAYAASKGGVVNLTRTLGAEWAPEIRVNAIAPSHARTNIGGGYLDEDSRVGQDIADEIEAKTPAERIAEPAEHKGLALFLAGRAHRRPRGPPGDGPVPRQRGRPVLHRLHLRRRRRVARPVRACRRRSVAAVAFFSVGLL